MTQSKKSDSENVKDEDKKIQKLIEHRDIVDFAVEAGEVNNINVERTEGDDPRGDFRFPTNQTQKLIEVLDKYLPGKRVK